MGQKITKHKPFEGFCAETAGALKFFGATHFGIPVSTTHTIGSIMGAGTTKGTSAVKWGVTKKIFWGMDINHPCLCNLWSIDFLFDQFPLKGVRLPCQGELSTSGVSLYKRDRDPKDMVKY